MKPLFNEHSIHEINNKISELIKSAQINNIVLFAARDESKLSVTLKPDINDNMYHGLHPKFSFDSLLEFVNSNNVCIPEVFWLAVKKLQKNESLMNLVLCEDDEGPDLFGGTFIKTNNTIEETLLGRAILQMASHFGFCFNVKHDLLSAIERDLNQYFTDEQIEFRDILYKIPDNEHIVFLGIWPESLIDALAKKYEINRNNENEYEIYAKMDANNDSNSLLSTFLKFQNISKDELIKQYKLRTSDVYYSGVMPRVKKLEYIQESDSAKNIKYFVFHVGRTTYATVNMMDNANIIRHPYFMGENSDRYKQMLQFDLYEDRLQEAYLYNSETTIISQREYEKSKITNINNYLKYSFNTHTIAVSANIETADNYLLFGKREKKAIDADKYYCSVNGQSEFLDENVSFYRTSVYEDLPTMDYYSKYRVDLENEIRREAIAELGFSAFNNNNYYGVSYLSINNYINTFNEKCDINERINQEKASKVFSRRMHFNVLSSVITPLRFEEILKSYEFATEKFENSSIIGLKTTVYKSRLSKVWRRLADAYKWLSKNKSWIFLILFFASYIINKNDASEITANNVSDVVFLFIYIAITVFNWMKSSEVRKKKRSISYIKNKKNRIDSIFKRFYKKIEKSSVHAIVWLMYALYYLDIDQ